MTLDQERWAEALAIERQHGAMGPVWIAERIGALASVGDFAGWLTSARSLPNTSNCSRARGRREAAPADVIPD